MPIFAALTPRRVSGLLMVAMLSGAVPAAAEPLRPQLRGNGVVLNYGSVDGPRATVTVNKNRAAPVSLAIDTFAAGQAGSRLAIFVDSDAAAVFEYAFKPENCRVEASQSLCRVTFPGRMAALGRLVQALRQGSVSRLDVTTADKGAVSMTTSLEGFNRAVGAR
jgi:hypothetical protein